ncbi:hypothetical protein CsSME_00036421 [Camellia sinensis var. sinensis]
MRFPIECSIKGGIVLLRRFTTWLSREGFGKPRVSSEAAIAHFHMKAETASTCVRFCTELLAAFTLRVMIAEASNANLLVVHFPILNKEPHLTIDESLSHKSFVGKREVAMKSGYTTSLDPQAVADQPFTKVLSAAPSRILCEMHSPIAIPPHSNMFT